MKWEPADKKDADKAPEAKSGAEKRRERHAKRRIVLIAIAAVVVLLALTRCVACGGKTAKALDWPTSGMATMLPEPPTKKGEVHTNSDTSLWVDVDQCSREAYDAYVTACEDAGFTVEAESEGSSYTAYSEDGYKLSLRYSESSEEMTIDLDAPIKMSTLSWPTSGPAALLPAPSSTKGKVDSDSSTRYRVYVGDTTQEQYAAYTDACSAAGFNVDYDRSDEWYRAKDAAGDSLDVSYVGFKTMLIEIELAEEPVAEPEPEPEPAAEPEPQADPAPAASTGGVSPEFKATMDSYEAFFDEYVAFMTKYANDGAPVSMLADYTSMMTRYTEAMEKLDAIDEGTLSEADLAYYVEVHGRITQKLLQVS